MKVKSNLAYQTKRQWALQGFLPKEGEQGVEYRASKHYKNSYIYYSPEQVQKATDEQLAEFFRPERERKNEQVRRRRAEEKERKEREYEWEKQEEINRAIRPYLERIAEQSKIIRALTNGKCTQDKGNKILVIDTETTGLDPENDEILQISIIDNEGNKLFDSYFKPFAESWNSAQKVHGISPEMVKNAPRISEKLADINAILCQANYIIGYNINFDLNFLRCNGVYIFDDIKIFDVMESFAEIYGDWSDYYQSYTWQELTTAANYYGYDWSSQPNGAHNSLSDCYATLFVYNHVIEHNDSEEDCYCEVEKLWKSNSTFVEYISILESTLDRERIISRLHYFIMDNAELKKETDKIISKYWGIYYWDSPRVYQYENLLFRFYCSLSK